MPRREPNLIERRARRRLASASQADRDFAHAEGLIDAEVTDLKELTAPYRPTADELAQRAASVRDSWTEAERRRRAGGVTDAVEVTEIKEHGGRRG